MNSDQMTNDTLKWWSLCEQQLECIENKKVRKAMLCTFHALKVYQGVTIRTTIPNPYYAENTTRPSHLAMEYLFGKSHLEIYLSLLNAVRLHKILFANISSIDL